MMCCNRQTLCICALAAGAVLVTAGIVLIFEFPKIIHNAVDKKMTLKDGTYIYQQWVTPPVAVYMQFWFWDLTNREDFVKDGAKPILKEKGPYTYILYPPKVNVTFSANGTLVSYREPKTYVFQRNMSVGSENDTFTNVNFPLLALATLARFEMPKFVEEILRPFLVAIGERLFEEFTVKGYLWGYDDPVIKKINDFTWKHFKKILIKNQTFGLFYGPTGNGTDDGEYTVYTGKQDISRYIDIKEWKGISSLPYWNTEYCNEINGTDGTGWHPFVQKDETLYLFFSEVCRSVYTTYEKDVTVKGIPMYRFTQPASVLADNATNPDNGGFCTPDCLGSGVLNVSTCTDGAPVVISQPHFYQGDKKYIDAFSGLNPNAEEHATTHDIEPITGVAMNAAKRLQFNFYVRHFDLIEDTAKMNDTVFPVLWINGSGLITDEAASKLLSSLLVVMSMSKILPWVLLAVGIVLALGAAGVLLRSQLCRKESDEPRKRLLTTEEPTSS